MQNALGPLVSMYQSQLEASRRFADAVFAGTEKIDHVMLGATHRAITEQLKFVQALAASGGDPRNAGTALQSGFLSRNPGNAINYQKELMQIVAEVQSDIGRSFQDYVGQLGTQAASGSTAALKSAPERANEAMFNPMTSMFSVWESAFKEVAALASKNMMTAASSAQSGMEAAGNAAAATAAAVTSSSKDLAGMAGEAVAQGNKDASVIITDETAEEKKGAGSPAGARRK